MRLASVILDIPTQSLDVAYSYIVPPDMLDLEVGCAVAVPFGYRLAVGYVIALEECPGDGSAAPGDGSAAIGGGPVPSVSPPNAFKNSPKAPLDSSKLKEIQQLLSDSYFNEQAAACAVFLSERYIAPLSSCIRLFTPPGAVPRVVRQGSTWQIEGPVAGPVDDRWVCLGDAALDFVPKHNAVKQRAIIEALKDGQLRVAELTTEFGSVSAVLNTLAASNVVKIFHRRRMRGLDGEGTQDFVPSRKPKLTEGQSRALGLINAAQDHARGEVIVLDGVTGSGKTEVYLQAIEKTLNDGLSAIVLVPEISLTPQTVARFRGRFGETVAVLHSRMGQGERYDQWDLVRRGQARVVVGARSALFAPLEKLGLVVIDEEHEGSYKQDSAPRYVTRDVAAWMVGRSGATLVLGSATPSIEALYRCNKLENWHRVVLPKRVNQEDLPRIEVVDRASEFASGYRSMFSQALSQALFETLDAGHKAVLLLNQRGFAKFVLCRNCGFVPECPSCSLSLTYHEKGSILLCHHCSHKEQSPALCPKCASPHLRKFGAGTQRVEADLRALLEGRAAKARSEFRPRASLNALADGEPAPKPVIVRMDADTTTEKGAHQRLLEEFGSAQAAVLLGTQMIAKGLDFDDVVLVGVISADTMLRLPDFRSSERTFNLIEQVAGRAGRRELAGRVIVQSYEADAPAIRAAAHYDRAAFLREELPKRKAFGYPPYVRLANLLVWGKNEAEVKELAEGLFADVDRLVCEAAVPGWVVLPAGPCVLSKLRDTYRWHILVKAPPDQDISALLLPLFRKRKPHKQVSVAVDIDPDDLF
ncbi:MAG: primosomal protein N' [Eggerthellaceae bacterium]|nr:primosomal protein N' [Eggerthellaceae bacterium]